MFQGRRKLRVRLTLHHSYCERFVVVSQDKVLCKDWGYINLGNCTVRETGDNGFQILPRDGDGDTLTFAVPSQQEVKDWVQVLNMSRPQGASPLRLALTPNPSPKSLTSKEDSKSEQAIYSFTCPWRGMNAWTVTDALILW